MIVAFILPLFLLALAYNLIVFDSGSDTECLDAGMMVGAAITAVLSGAYGGLKAVLEAILPAIAIAWMTKTNDIPSHCMP